MTNENNNTPESTRVKAEVVGQVQFREGDGPMMDIRPGPVDVELTALDAIFSWTEGDAASRAAMPRVDYEHFVSEGMLRVTA